MKTENGIEVFLFSPDLLTILREKNDNNNNNKTDYFAV